MNHNETNFEICKNLGFGAKLQNITRTCLEYIGINTRLESFPAKNRHHRGQLHSIHPYGKDVLKTRVWEANDDQR